MASSTPRAGSDPLAGTSLEAVIGLEVHVQLATRTKMFCGCENRFGAPPNSLVCPVCLGYPGALPVTNEQAVRYALRVATTFGSRIERFTKFDRKSYFYPDLPKNYQISQFDEPIGLGGNVEIELDGQRSNVVLKRLHMEEDAGKNIHVDGRDASHVDLNRAGVPLLEIVTEPVIRSAAEASAFLRTMRLILLYLEVSDCNMEEGSFRCDVNVSLRPRGSTELETRTEIKNLNSFTFIENALNFEIDRQRKLRERGGSVTQETRLFDPNAGVTKSMRGKEEAHDYRYFPEPDLSPIIFDDADFARARDEIGEMPLARQDRYTSSLGLQDYHADILVRDPPAARFFDAAVSIYPDGAKSIANWIVNSLKEEMNTRKASPGELGLTPESFADLVRAVDDDTLSAQKGRDVFRALLDGLAEGRSETVEEIIERLGLRQISDDSFLRSAVEKVIAAHPGPADELRAGKDRALHFLMGQVMRETKGQANPGVVTTLIRELLGV